MSLANYDTHKLVGLIESNKKPLPYFLQRFFGSIMEFDSEEVHFDAVLGERKMAPFVSPIMAGVIMRSKGSTMKSFRPAYVKPKHEVNPSKVLKRLPGEALLGALSPAQRMDRAIAANYMAEDEMIDNRMEWMAVQILKTGMVTIEGPDYPKKVIDYGRSAGNSVTLLGTDRWGQVDADVLGDLEDISTAASLADHGAPITEFYMDPAAYKLFRKDPDVKALLDTNYRGSNANINREPTTFDANSDPKYMGTVGAFAIYVDARQYTDDTGAVVPYLASGEVIGASGAVEGVQAFGAIMDVDVLRPMRAYAKTWIQQDPSVRMTMTQSAPLPIVARQNATVYLKIN